MPGGFVGVDIFFVISGFLITQILIKESIKGTFSYLNFYIRRIKRLYPALIVVLLFVLTLSIILTKKPILFHTRNLTITMRTLTASTVFCANLEVLMHKQDYFDPSVK